MQAKRMVLTFALALGLLPLFLSGCEVIVQVPPEACFTVSNTRPMVGEEVVLDGVCSEARSWDGYVASYDWQINGQKRQGRIISHTFSSPGTYTITLTVTDNYGQQGSTSGTVEVQPAPGKVSLWLESVRVQPGGTAEVGLYLRGQADEIIIGDERLLDTGRAGVVMTSGVTKGEVVPLNQELWQLIQSGVDIPAQEVLAQGIVPQPKGSGIHYDESQVTPYAYRSNWEAAVFAGGGVIKLHLRLNLQSLGIVPKPEGTLLLKILFYCPVIGTSTLEIIGAQAFSAGQSVQVELPDQPATITVGW